MSRNRFTFVVPVRNDASRLAVALRSIASSIGPGTQAEVVVVDNGSTDESPAVARAHGAVVLERPGLSVSALRNEGARAATGDVLAFVDADNEIDSRWLAAATELFADPAIGAVGAPYSPPPAANWVQRVYDSLRDHRVGAFETDWLGSGNLAVRRDIFMQVGGFDEGLITCEDVDLCLRIRGRAHRLVSDSRLRSVHHGDPRTLKAVFLGELWRGRDNLRVTFRPPRSWRSWVSLGISVVMLVAASALLLGLGLRSSVLAIAGTAAIAGLILLRTARLARPMRLRPLDLLQACGVATAYEFGRALALVARIPHHRKHPLRSSPAHV